MKGNSVRERLVQHASALIRRRGYNGFSYRDLANLVGVKTSSIHYHFPAKGDLVFEVMRQYSEMSSLQLQAIDIELPLVEQANRYVHSLQYNITLNEVCLAGMLSADILDLSDAVRSQLHTHFDMHEQWINGLLRRAESERGQAYPVPTLAFAKVLYGAMQNGIIARRITGSTDHLDATASLLLGAVSVQGKVNELSEVATDHLLECGLVHRRGQK